VRWAIVGRLWTRLGLLWATEVDLARTGVGRLWLPSGVWRTINNQLRTGTDKGNLTV
jgi:hypothetical protein